MDGLFPLAALFPSFPIHDIPVLSLSLSLYYIPLFPLECNCGFMNEGLFFQHFVLSFFNNHLSLSKMLACVGDSFPAAEQICGVVVSLRKTQDRLSVWTSNSADKESAIAIGYDIPFPFARNLNSHSIIPVHFRNPFFNTLSANFYW
tara:strand:+ start:339 stop:779 length:441 start_codon:yes stop_codon:yes gene_type:complete